MRAVDPEFTKAIWDYLDILVNDNRLAKGREILARYKTQFDAVEKAYTVLASQFLNERFAFAAGLQPWQMGLGHAFEMDPAIRREARATLIRKRLTAR